MRQLAITLCFLGAAVVVFAQTRGLGGGSEPEDVLGAVHQFDRAGRVRIIREMISTDFETDRERADFHNQQMEALREERERPYVDALAHHLANGTAAEFADALEDSL